MSADFNNQEPPGGGFESLLDDGYGPQFTFGLGLSQPPHPPQRSGPVGDLGEFPPPSPPPPNN